jgi:hypothetical protein
MKKNRASSNVVCTRLLSAGEMESVMADIGVVLLAARFAPQAHTNRLLTYQREYGRKSPVYAGLFLPIKVVAPGVAFPLGKGKSKSARAVVKVTDLPVSFSVDEGSAIDIVVGHAFGISAPDDVRPRIEGVLEPYQEDPERLSGGAAQHLVGRPLQKKVPGVACDHCGTVQEVSIPTEIARVEGNRGYGPGGSASVMCSNPLCRKSFDVTWDSVVVEVDFTE